MREGDAPVVPKLDWLARFVPDARARGKLPDKQPKLSVGQRLELYRMRAAGRYSISDLARLLFVSRQTAYRSLSRLYSP